MVCEEDADDISEYISDSSYKPSEGVYFIVYAIYSVMNVV